MRKTKWQDIKDCFVDYILVVLAVLVISILIRLLEYLYILTTSREVVSLDLLFSNSINFDTLFILLAFILPLLPMLLIVLVSVKLARAWTRIFAFAVLFTNLLFTHYFLTNHSLLTSVFLEFSLGDILSVGASELTWNRVPLWLGTLSILSLAFFVLRWKISKIRLSRNWQVVLVLVYATSMVVSVVNRSNTFRSIQRFDSSYLFLVGNSKHVYFIKSYLNKTRDDISDFSDVEHAIIGYQEVRKFKYSDRAYPFVHATDAANVLGPYFEDQKPAPNIVLIISESLSSSFSGSAMGLPGSITPFTDHLAKNGLSWSRFFSNAERSYGVLPNILASLPAGIGERGFINMDRTYPTVKNYPTHYGLIQLLKNNGYETNYFYGGWGQYDHIEQYLKENGIDNFIDWTDFDTEKYALVKGSWGYNDKDLFSQSIDFLASSKNDTPFLAVYQTLSLHTPFNLAEEEYYTDSLINHKLGGLDLLRDDLQDIPDEVLSCILFADDALHELLDAYSERDDYENTIFIITGDHSIDLNLVPHNFENFHVPLVIYSPLLDSTSEFKGACSHIDLLPSLASLLEQNFGLNIPKKNHWIGEGLDTSSTPQFQRMIPLNLRSLEMPNFVYNDCMLYAGEAMRLDSNLLLAQEPDATKIERLVRLYKDYLLLNLYVCSEDKIWKNEITP